MASIRIPDSRFDSKFAKSIQQDLNALDQSARLRWKRLAKLILKSEIEKSLSVGKSPVKGGGDQTGGRQRFQRYSPSYSKQIRDGRYRQFSKRQRPVNLKLSGKMRNSLKARDTRTGITLFYQSEIAKFHDTLGAGKSKVIRKLLPDPGQSFSRLIERKLINLYNRVISQL